MECGQERSHRYPHLGRGDMLPDADPMVCGSEINTGHPSGTYLRPNPKTISSGSRKSARSLLIDPPSSMKRSGSNSIGFRKSEGL